MSIGINVFLICWQNWAEADRTAFWAGVPMVGNFAFSSFSEKWEMES